MDKPPITTHVLDLQSGRPASGMAVAVYRNNGERALASGMTDGDGRVSRWDGEFDLQPIIYRLEFATGDWFRRAGIDALYPEVTIRFQVEAGRGHYHIPLLLSPFGYSTYRGS